MMQGKGKREAKLKIKLSHTTYTTHYRLHSDGFLPPSITPALKCE
jgi:hypothetical protein